MGLRDRIKSAMNKLSGEHSDAAPTEYSEKYTKPGKPNEEAEVVMARLNRPKRSKK